MKTKLHQFLFSFSCLFLFISFSAVFAGDLQNAQDSFNRKDYETARKLWAHLAKDL